MPWHWGRGQTWGVILGAIVTGSCWGEGSAIAGLQPGMRPENAPVVTEFLKDRQWYEQALRGITKPYPYSLRFLEDQGAWHTPFTHPGVSGRYDIRGLYGADR